jgi:hypothetical protein
MGEITRRVALYNRAYFLAWQGLPERTRVTTSDISARLDEAVRAQIRCGRTDPVQVAASAVREVFPPLGHTIYAPPRRPRPLTARRFRAEY